MFYRSSIVLFCLFFVAASAVAQQRFVANLSGLQEVPLNNSSARGVCTVKLQIGDATSALEFECNYSGLGGALRAYLHADTPVGQNGPSRVDVPLLGDNGGFAMTIFGLSDADVANLRANRWYLNFTSNAYPGGEIRGQIKLANGTYNDHDGDGRTDLQVYRTTTNTFFAERSTVGTGDLIIQPLGQPGDSVSLTVDFDGDGRSDFSTARYSAEVIWRVINSSTGVLQETRWGSSSLGDFFAAADYDGDGKMDIAVFRAGVWHIIESSTNTFRYEYWGQSGDVPAANDFDRDGKADLTIARSEGGQRVWYTRMSNNPFTRVIPWGLSSDAFFTGRSDFDGDAAADISVIRNEGGQRVFYVLRSSDSQLQVIPWGLSSDVVKLGDYDGDGKTDPAVTRAENGQRVFYILQSSTGLPRYAAFGLSGDF